MPLTPAERTGLENLKNKIDTAMTRIEGQITTLDTEITDKSNQRSRKREKVNDLTNAKEAVQTILDLDAGGDL